METTAPEMLVPPITREVVIDKDHHLKLELDLPPDCPEGEAVVTVTIRPRKVNRLGEYFDWARGSIRMSEDFDAPLPDFAEYM